MLFADIETLGDLAVLDRSTSPPPPANYKSASALAGWAERNPPTDEVWRKTALHRLKLRVVTVCWAVDDGPVRTLSASYPPLAELDGMSRKEAAAVLNRAESAIIHAFSDLIGRRAGEQWCGWNCNGFDWPALFLRAVKYGAGNLRSGVPHDKWAKGSVDLMELWKCTDYRGKYTRCADAVAYLGGQPQAGIDGSEVFDAWNEGRLSEVEAHCAADIEDLRWLHARICQ